GAFASGFLLYGTALLYGAAGTTQLAAIARTVAKTPHDPLVLVGLALLLVGFGFKVAMVPFHGWTPDVYEGAPTTVTAFMAVGVKAAAFAPFARVLSGAFGTAGGGGAAPPRCGRGPPPSRRKLTPRARPNLTRSLA